MKALSGVLVVLVLVAGSGVHVRGQTRLMRQVVGSGATASASPQYLMAGTVGQTIVGRSTSSSNVGALGFWYTYPYAYTTGLPADHVAGVTGVSPTLSVAPNPTRGAASVTVSLPYAAHVTLSVYDATGSRRLILLQKRIESGTTTMAIPANALESGEYAIVLSSGPSLVSSMLSVVR